jgi:outer membrane protein assembly factor BamB
MEDLMPRITFNGSPVLGQNGTIYVAAGKITETYQGGGSTLYALYPDGRQKWLCTPDLGIWADPLLSTTGLIYLQATFKHYAEVTFGDFTRQEMRHDRAVAIDPETGTVIRPLPLHVQTHGLVMDSHGTFYYFEDDDRYDLIAEPLDGEPLWIKEDLGCPLVDPHVIGHDCIVYICVSSLTHQIYLYSLGNNGETRWQRDLAAPARLALNSRDLLLVWQYASWECDGMVQLLTPDGGLLWEHVLGEPNDSVPGFGPDDDVYLFTDAGRLVVVAWDGTFRWERPVPSAITGGPRVALDGTCYFGCEDHCLYAVGPDGSYLWQYQTGGEIRSVPAIAPDGTIYVGSDDGYFYALCPDGSERWRFGTAIERSIE